MHLGRGVQERDGQYVCTPERAEGSIRTGFFILIFFAHAHVGGRQSLPFVHMPSHSYHEYDMKIMRCVIESVVFLVQSSFVAAEPPQHCTRPSTSSTTTGSRPACLLLSARGTPRFAFTPSKRYHNEVKNLRDASFERKIKRTISNILLPGNDQENAYAPLCGFHNLRSYPKTMRYTSICFWHRR